MANRNSISEIFLELVKIRHWLTTGMYVTKTIFVHRKNPIQDTLTQPHDNNNQMETTRDIFTNDVIGSQTY